MNKGKIALGTIIGVAAGIVAGVLTAPKSGKETRADLKEKATELKNEAKKKVDSSTHSTKEPRLSSKTDFNQTLKRSESYLKEEIKKALEKEQG